EGTYYRTRKATIYERPDQPIPIYVAASGPLAGRMAGRIGDGLIATSGKASELYAAVLGKVEEGRAQRGAADGPFPRQIEVKVSYDADRRTAEEACTWWAALGLAAEQKQGVDDPVELERLADADPSIATKRFI